MLSESIERNLRDAGCSEEFVVAYEQLPNDPARLRKLACYRKELLASIHAQQKELDCLDYLVYSIKKNDMEGV